MEYRVMYTCMPHAQPGMFDQSDEESAQMNERKTGILINTGEQSLLNSVGKEEIVPVAHIINDVTRHIDVVPIENVEIING